MENAGEPLREFIKGLRWEEEFLFEKGRECSSTTAFVVLFATAFLTSLTTNSGCSALFFCSHSDSPHLYGMAILTLWTISLNVCWIPIAFLHVRSAKIVWVSVFPAALLGSELVVYYVFFVMGIQPNPPFWERLDSIINHMPPFFAFAYSSLMTGYALIRASYLFSETTNSWLHSYVLNKTFTLPGDAPTDSLTLDDVLRFERTKRKSDS